MNIESFSGNWWSFVEADSPPVPWWDEGAEFVREVFFAGKFNSLFSFLFALGFTIQLERLFQREPERAKQIYVRRLIVLFVIGWLHGSLLWTGDILHLYAVMGFVLLLIRSWSNRVLYVLLGIGLTYPGLRSLVLALFAPREWSQQRFEGLREMAAASDRAFGHGSFSEAVVESSRQMIVNYIGPGGWDFILMVYILILVTVLLGLIAGRRRWLQTAAANMALVRKVQWWSLGLGIVVAVIATVTSWYLEPGVPSLGWVVFRTTYGLARVCIMVFYVATIVRLAENPRWHRWLLPLAAAGRMPLTNYLMQTLICTFIFYGWGLGYWRTTGAALNLALAFGIFFGVQVPLSIWWFRRFSYGPMEYLWRTLTYGRRPATAREPSPT